MERSELEVGEIYHRRNQFIRVLSLEPCSSSENHFSAEILDRHSGTYVYVTTGDLLPHSIGAKVTPESVAEHDRLASEKASKLQRMFDFLTDKGIEFSGTEDGWVRVRMEDMYRMIHEQDVAISLSPDTVDLVRKARRAELVSDLRQSSNWETPFMHAHARMPLNVRSGDFSMHQVKNWYGLSSWDVSAIEDVAAKLSGDSLRTVICDYVENL